MNRMDSSSVTTKVLGFHDRSQLECTVLYTHASDAAYITLLFSYHRQFPRVFIPSPICTVKAGNLAINIWKPKSLTHNHLRTIPFERFSLFSMVFQFVLSYSFQLLYEIILAGNFTRVDTLEWYKLGDRDESQF